MNILVTGANGQLGNEMRIIARTAGDCSARGAGDCDCGGLDPQDRFIFTDVNQVEGLETTFLDITDLDAIRRIVAENNVRAIVNCAAWTNVEGAEDPEKLELVERLNATAPENLAIAMREAGGLLIQISTDYVFGKEPYNTPCREDQQGTPTGVYGLTKLHGEQRIMAAGCSYVIIRTAWLYSEFGKNFCKTMLNLTATKPQLKVVFDQVGTPTYALDLARAIARILETFKACSVSGAASGAVSGAVSGAASGLSGGAGISGHSEACSTSTAFDRFSGIYHFSNEGVCSWYDFARMIAEYSGQTGCDIQPCHSSEFPSAVTRPSYSVLDKTRIKEVFGVSVPYWTDSLKKCIANINGDRSFDISPIK